MHPTLEKYLMGSRFAGIEAEMRGDGCFFHAVVIKRSGNKLQIEKSASELSSVDQLKEHLPKDIPCTIVFTGKGILNRVVHADPDAEPYKLLGKILPNASLKDFHLGDVPSSNGGKIVSVVRKTTLDTALEQLKEINMVVSCIGPMIVSEPLKMSGINQGLVQSGNYTIQFDGALPADVIYNENTRDQPDIELGDEKISSRLFIAFSAAFQSALAGCNNLNTAIDATGGQRENYLQKQLFRKSVRAVLVGTLLLLMANYFAFTHYWKLQEELTTSLQGQTNIIADVNLLEEQVKLRTEFLNRSGLLNNSSFAWYADQLAHGLPDGINLTRLNFSPRIKVANEDSIGFNATRLEISGRCGESVVLNNWLQELKQREWIANAGIRSYQQMKTGNEGEFILDISLQ